MWCGIEQRSDCTCHEGQWYPLAMLFMYWAWDCDGVDPCVSYSQFLAIHLEDRVLWVFLSSSCPLSSFLYTTDIFVIKLSSVLFSLYNGHICHQVVLCPLFFIQRTYLSSSYPLCSLYNGHICHQVVLCSLYNRHICHQVLCSLYNGHICHQVVLFAAYMMDIFYLSSSCPLFFM